jgi:hypothetical protein
MIIALLLAAAQPATPTPPPPGDDVRTEQQAQGLSFAYAWPRAVQDVPRLRAELERQRARARRGAEACRRSADNPCEQPYSYEQSWVLLGRSPRLVSLVSVVETYLGGAHGSADYAGLLWDQRRGTAIGARNLFTGGRYPASFLPRYCAALNAIRRERRGPEQEPMEEYERCVPLDQVLVLPSDADQDGRFDTLSVQISPYVAGPWAEGPYEPEVPMTQADVAAIRADLRGEFEVAGR